MTPEREAEIREHILPFILLHPAKGLTLWALMVEEVFEARDAERATVEELDAALTIACDDNDYLERRVDQAEAKVAALREALEDSRARCTMRLKLSCEECYQHQVMYEVAAGDMCKVHEALAALVTE